MTLTFHALWMLCDLATGTLAYVVAVVRQGWVNETVHDQRFLAERIASELAGART